MIIKLIFVIFFLALFLPSNAVKCKAALDVKGNKFSICEGKYCFREFRTSGEVKYPTTEMLGCVSGFPYIEPGCILDKENNSLCFCNNSDMCNEHEMNNSSETLNQMIECFSGPVKDGKVIGKTKCRGHFCSLVHTWQGDKKIVNVTAGCDEPRSHTYQFFKGTGCIFLNTSTPEKPDNERYCKCDADLCNSPSSFPTSNKTGSVKCVYTSQNDTSLQTCQGDYCFTAKAVAFGTPMLQKGCATLSNGAKLAEKKFEINISAVENTMQFCQTDLCNKV